MVGVEAGWALQWPHSQETKGPDSWLRWKVEQGHCMGQCVSCGYNPDTCPMSEGAATILG